MPTMNSGLTLRYLVALTRSKPLSAGPPHCELCGEVIGVYEPLVRIVDGRLRRTSRAAEPELAAGDDCYHDSCYLSQRQLCAAG
jgi:hypothetical protein